MEDDNINKPENNGPCCPKCGTCQKPDAQFCSVCGTRIPIYDDPGRSSESPLDDASAEEASNSIEKNKEKFNIRTLFILFGCLVLVILIIFLISNRTKELDDTYAASTEVPYTIPTPSISNEPESTPTTEEYHIKDSRNTDYVKLDNGAYLEYAGDYDVYVKKIYAMTNYQRENRSHDMDGLYVRIAGHVTGVGTNGRIGIASGAAGKEFLDDGIYAYISPMAGQEALLSSLNEDDTVVAFAKIDDYSYKSSWLESSFDLNDTVILTVNGKNVSIPEDFDPFGTVSLRSADQNNANVPDSSTAQIFPSTYLDDDTVSKMDAETIQYCINTIYAKNGYIFQTPQIYDYFCLQPWYNPVSSNVTVEGVDKANAALLVSYRANFSDYDTSNVGKMWTFYMTDSPLSEQFVSSLSKYDIQLLINTIYAKRGYIFFDDNMQKMFSNQYWYYGTTRDKSGLAFSKTDKVNLSLLGRYQ